MDRGLDRGREIQGYFPSSSSTRWGKFVAVSTFQLWDITDILESFDRGKKRRSIDILFSFSPSPLVFPLQWKISSFDGFRNFDFYFSFSVVYRSKTKVFWSETGSERASYATCSSRIWDEIWIFIGTDSVEIEVDRGRNLFLTSVKTFLLFLTFIYICIFHIERYVLSERSNKTLFHSSRYGYFVQTTYKFFQILKKFLSNIR